MAKKFPINPLRFSLSSFVKAFLIAMIILPFTFSGFSSSIKSEENSSRKQNSETSNKASASREETFLYRQIAINFLCRARLANVEFPKALGISSATFADILTQKHGGFVAEVPDTKLNPKQLYLSAEIQVLEGSIKFCPDQVPNDAKKKFKEFMKKDKKRK